MRKTLITLSLAAALFTGQAMADQATVDCLQTEGIVLSAEQTAAIGVAEGQELVDAIAALVAANPDQAAAIVRAAVRANPSLAEAIKAAATQAAPGQADAIAAAVEQGISEAGSARGIGSKVPSSSLPSICGCGGGSTSTASPN